MSSVGEYEGKAEPFDQIIRLKSTNMQPSLKHIDGSHRLWHMDSDIEDLVIHWPVQVSCSLLSGRHGNRFAPHIAAFNILPLCLLRPAVFDVRHTQMDRCRVSATPLQPQLLSAPFPDCRSLARRASQHQHLMRTLPKREISINRVNRLLHACHGVFGERRYQWALGSSQNSAPTQTSFRWEEGDF